MKSPAGLMHTGLPGGGGTIATGQTGISHAVFSGVNCKTNIAGLLNALLP